jgi:hypothetical protein
MFRKFHEGPPSFSIRPVRDFDGIVKSPDAALRFSLPLLSQGRLIAAYAKVRLIPQGSRALPAAFLRSRPIFATFKTFYEIVNFGNFISIMILPKNNLCTTHSFDRVDVFESSSLVSPGTTGH